jgi:hypothetical protein
MSGGLSRFVVLRRSEMDARFAEMKARFAEMRISLNLAIPVQIHGNIVKASQISHSGGFSPVRTLGGKLQRCSAGFQTGFQTCCIADFPAFAFGFGVVGRASENAEGNGIRNTRRFRNLRCFRSVRVTNAPQYCSCGNAADEGYIDTLIAGC